MQGLLPKAVAVGDFGAHRVSVDGIDEGYGAALMASGSQGGVPRASVHVPASGITNGRPRGAKNQAYKISLRNGALCDSPDYWETWAPEVGEPVKTFTIITMQANKFQRGA